MPPGKGSLRRLPIHPRFESAGGAVDGRFLIRDDLMIAVSEDAAGTIMVKRYRLVLATEE